MAHPVPTMSFLKPSPDTAICMLFAPFTPTSPYPTLSAHRIAGSDITSSKSCGFQSLVVKGLKKETQSLHKRQQTIAHIECSDWLFQFELLKCPKASLKDEWHV